MGGWTLVDSESSSPAPMGSRVAKSVRASRCSQLPPFRWDLKRSPVMRKRSVVNIKSAEVYPLRVLIQLSPGGWPGD